jgi:membrane associated rhomboid family serine protease
VFVAAFLLPFAFFIIIVVVLGVLSLFTHWWAIALVSFLGGLFVGVMFSERIKRIVDRLRCIRSS